MIEMKDFRVLVPTKADALLGYTGEHLSRRLMIAVDDPGAWAYKLDVRDESGTANIIDLIADDGVLYADIEREALRVSGKVQAQVRAIDGDVVKCSNIFSLFVCDSVQAAEQFESLPPSEFEQMEARMTALKQAAEGSAEAALSSASAAGASATSAADSASAANIAKESADASAKAAEEIANSLSDSAEDEITRIEIAGGKQYKKVNEAGASMQNLIDLAGWGQINTIKTEGLGYVTAAQEQADLAAEAAGNAAGSEQRAGEHADRAETAAGNAAGSEQRAGEHADRAEAAAIRQPYPSDETGTWWVWDAETGAYADSGQPTRGAKGDAFVYADFTSAQLAALKGEKGEKGDPFTYADFTSAQLAALKGEKGDKGDTGAPGATGAKGDKGDTGAKGDQGETGATGAKGDKGDTGAKGDKGEKGDPFTYADFTSAQLAALKGDKGDKGDTGAQGDKGEDGISAYQAAQDGGYTGTNQEFNEALADIPDHISSTDNPHSVTTEQIGAASKDYVDEQVGSVSQSKLDKPATAPKVGKILKVTSVNEDGTFTCEWCDSQLPDPSESGYYAPFLRAVNGKWRILPGELESREDFYRYNNARNALNTYQSQLNEISETLNVLQEDLDARQADLEALRDELEARKEEFLREHGVESADMLDEDAKAEYDALVAEGEAMICEAEEARDAVQETVDVQTGLYNYILQEMNNSSKIMEDTAYSLEVCRGEIQPTFLLPYVTDADNGKTLKVVDGIWQAVEN